MDIGLAILKIPMSVQNSRTTPANFQINKKDQITTSSFTVH